MWRAGTSVTFSKRSLSICPLSTWKSNFTILVAWMVWAGFYVPLQQRRVSNRTFGVSVSFVTQRRLLRVAFQSVRSSLQNAGLSIPALPGDRTDTKPSVTVLILPGDNRPGMLETLLCESFKDEPENRCIDGFFDCFESIPGMSIDRPYKARAHAYLATRPDPHVSVGVAAKNGYWNLDHPVLGDVRDFLMSII